MNVSYVASGPRAAERRPLRRLWRRELGETLRLSWPLATTQLAQMAVSTTDVVMLGRLGERSLAAAAIALTLFYFAWMIGFGPVAALSPLIAQAEGRTGRAAVAEVRRIARMGLWAILIMSPPMMALLEVGGPILRSLGQKPELAAGAGRLLSMLAFGLPFSWIFQALRSVATAQGRPKAALAVMAATIGFNAAADWALIFGHLGFPRLGLLGAGVATSSSFVFSAGVMAAVFRVSGRLARLRILRRFGRFDASRLLEIFRLGLPIGLTMLAEAMIFNTMTLVMGAMGPAPLAAHQIALNFASMTFMAPLGIGMAATIRVGNAAGAGDLVGARRAGLAAMILASGFAGLAAAAMALFGERIAALYIPAGAAGAAAVASLARSFLLVAAAFQLFDALQVVSSLSLRGLKDARAPMLIAGASYWIVGAPACLLLAFPAGLGGVGIWIGLALGLAAAAALLGGRFLHLTRAGGPGAPT